MIREAFPYFRRDQQSGRVHEVLAEKREAAGFSRSELAHRAGISYGTLGRIERNDQKPTPKTLRSLAEALAVSMEALCDNWGRIEEDRPRNGAKCLGIGFRFIRKRAGVTLKQAAKVAGISASTLSRFERGIFVTPRRIAAIGAEGSASSSTPALICAELAELLGFNTAAELTAACVAVREGRLDPLDQDDLAELPAWLRD